jgi:hypothetical protein
MRAPGQLNPRQVPQKALHSPHAPSCVNGYIGVGTELIPTEAIERRQSQRIHELARRFAKLVKDARQEIEAWQRTQVVKEFTGAEKCEK